MKIGAVSVVMVLLLARLCGAAALVNESRAAGPGAESATLVFHFEPAEPRAGVGFYAAAHLEEGTVTFRLLDPAGTEVLRQSGRVMVVQSSPDLKEPGRYRLEVKTNQARGRWQVLVYPVPPRASFAPHLVSGPAMICVGVVAVIWWRRRAPSRWSWFLIGAALWTVGVALKIGFALALNRVVLGFLDARLQWVPYLIAASLYIGLLTGIFEVGITGAAALIWRRLAADAAGAVAIGIGAGAIEAILLGLGTLSGAVATMIPSPQTKPMLMAQALVAATTPLAWLIAPVERILTIPIHVGGRVGALLGVARRRWAPFWAGFLLMTIVDAVAGWALLSGAINVTSVWWVELAITPLAIAGLAMTLRYVRRWPSNSPMQQPATTAAAT